MRPKGDEALRLLPLLPAQHLLHRTAQIVVILFPSELCGRIYFSP
jgi:hypothetical protein